MLRCTYRYLYIHLILSEPLLDIYFSQSSLAIILLFLPYFGIVIPDSFIPIHNWSLDCNGEIEQRTLSYLQHYR